MVNKLFIVIKALSCQLTFQWPKEVIIRWCELINECKNMVQNADGVYDKLLNCQRAGLEWHEDLENVCQQAGLRGKKFSKATENFAWNIRVLKGQADLLKQAKKECNEYIRQIKEAAVTTGLARDGSNSGNSNNSNNNSTANSTTNGTDSPNGTPCTTPTMEGLPLPETHLAEES
ncbi:phosphoinositide phospholipase C [Elysia marginata]|uniref:Phosphoinositide phospholipase C n=1 Tax=Elysia marginata TaxID=1093978 RepID=A0AAV4I519_9GAST|nr:phosphoinositide phospholipase C [Elysia marginata]